jgi:hypothetical protein
MEYSRPRSINSYAAVGPPLNGSLKLVGMARQDIEELRQKLMKRTLVLVFPAILALTSTGYAADVRVIDSSGVEVHVRDITIDYSGLLGSDKETEGVRVSQGEALVTAKWADIQSITITGRDPSAARMTLEIVLKDGKKVPATLVRKGRMRLMGKADLGEYSIDLEKVRKIVTVSAK